MVYKYIYDGNSYGFIGLCILRSCKYFGLTVYKIY